MRKCEWHLGDSRCDKFATHVDIKDRGFCMEHADCGCWYSDEFYRIPLDGEILAHLLREEITRDSGPGQAAVLDGLDYILGRVAERWNKGDL